MSRFPGCFSLIALVSIGASVAVADPTSAAVELVRRKVLLLAKIGVNLDDSVYNPRADDAERGTAVSTAVSTRTDTAGNRIETTTMSTSTQGGGVSASAKWRMSRAASDNPGYAAEIDRIDAQLATYPPAVVAAAYAQVERERSENPFRIVAGVPAFFLALPGTKMYSLGGHVYAGTDDAGGGGFTVQGSMTNVVGVANAGAMVAMNAELGGYSNGGAAGWIGFDLGFGVRSRTAYLGVGWGIHYGGLLESRKYAPAVAMFGVRHHAFGLAVNVGAGWRYTGGAKSPGVDPDDPAVDATYDLPLGFEAYHAQLLLNLWSKYQLGASYQDMDGVKTGGVLFGVGAIAFTDNK